MRSNCCSEKNNKTKQKIVSNISRRISWLIGTEIRSFFIRKDHKNTTDELIEFELKVVHETGKRFQVLFRHSYDFYTKTSNWLMLMNNQSIYILLLNTIVT